jgi:hypothetical protein
MIDQRFCDLNSNDLNEKLLSLLENKIEKCLNQIDSDGIIDEYFFYFIQHLSMYYLYLNEKSHNFKLQRSHLMKIMYENTDAQEEFQDAQVVDSIFNEEPIIRAKASSKMPKFGNQSILNQMEKIASKDNQVKSTRGRKRKS